MFPKNKFKLWFVVLQHQQTETPAIMVLLQSQAFSVWDAHF